MDPRRMLPYIGGLLILAFALASLSRSQLGSSILFRSYWLLYLIYLGPVVILGIVVVLIVLIGLNWRELGAAIGFGLAQKRAMRKRRSRYSFWISLLFWAIAIGVLIERPGSIFNPTQTNTTAIANIVGESETPSNPFLGGRFLPTVSSLVQNSWFSISFLGLLIVASLVLIQSVRVAMKEIGEMNSQELEVRRKEGLDVVNLAIMLVDDRSADPRTRIITCYQHMIAAVTRLGVPVSSDQTARELERTISSTFMLKGSATAKLTQLFEEARYSLHDITDEDAANAREYLESIAGELSL